MKRSERKLLGAISIGLCVLSFVLTLFFSTMFIWAESNNDQWAMTATMTTIVTIIMAFAGGMLMDDGLYKDKE